MPSILNLASNWPPIGKLEVEFGNLSPGKFGYLELRYLVFSMFSAFID